MRGERNGKKTYSRNYTEAYTDNEVSGSGHPGGRGEGHIAMLHDVAKTIPRLFF